MEDPTEWLPNFLRDRWDTAVESLRAEGVNVSEVRPSFLGSHSQAGGGDIDAGVVVKVWESGDFETSRVTHGDLDRDAKLPITLDVKRKRASPGAARRANHDAVQVLIRLLEMHRSEPHPDWNRVEEVKARTIESYWNYDHRVVNFQLRRYGQVLVDRVYADLD